MLEYVYRFSVKPGRMGDFLGWLDENEAGFNEHAAPGWEYLDSWFAVRGFGRYDCEFRYRLDGYGSLGTGFGDDENIARLNDFFSEFLDYSHRPEAVLLKTRDTLQVVEGF